MLPQALPQLQHLCLRGFSKPTRHVGGDFYDFLQQPSGEWIGVLGDVSGKGIAASLLSSMFLGCLELLLRSGVAIEDALNRLNEFLLEKSSSSRFVTLFLFVLDQTGGGAFISAGHNTAYLLRRATDVIEELPSNNMLLGAFDFVQYQASPLQLYQGDVLLVYSDGVT